MRAAPAPPTSAPPARQAPGRPGPPRASAALPHPPPSPGGTAPPEQDEICWPRCEACVPAKGCARPSRQRRARPSTAPHQGPVAPEARQSINGAPPGRRGQGGHCPAVPPGWTPPEREGARIRTRSHQARPYPAGSRRRPPRARARPARLAARTSGKPAPLAPLAPARTSAPAAFRIAPPCAPPLPARPSAPGTAPLIPGSGPLPSPAARRPAFGTAPHARPGGHPTRAARARRPPAPSPHPRGKFVCNRIPSFHPPPNPLRPPRSEHRKRIPIARRPCRRSRWTTPSSSSTATR